MPGTRYQVTKRPGLALGVRSDKKSPKYLHQGTSYSVVPWETLVSKYLSVFVWSFYLYCGVNSKSKDAKKKSVEHAEDWGPAIVWVLLGTCKNVVIVLL